MNENSVIASLLHLAGSENFIVEAYRLTEAWASDPDGVNAIEPIPRFIKTNTAIDLGAPGPLVHFVERYDKKGYEERFLQSIDRKPVAHTLKILNRIINGTCLAASSYRCDEKGS